jgi:hypothetical protein
VENPIMTTLRPAARTANASPAVELESRIRAAFENTVTSDDVVSLIAEAERAAVSSAAVAERSRTRALDPALSASAVAAARRRMEDAQFRRDRMSEAVRRLGERLREVKAQEEQARRREAYDAALAERDKLAKELAHVYPPIAEKLADLAARIASNDDAVERANRKLPEGAKWLANAELLARGLRSFNDGTSDVPRIAVNMRLPAFQYTAHIPYTWPRIR